MSAENNNDKPVILLVDDKPINIVVLEHLLAHEGRILLTATGGEEALKIALSRNVDLVILDVQMPEMNGFEVAQILKSNKRTENIPIIFATAESKERKLMIKGYDEGGVDYLLKPLDPEIVCAKVNVLLKIHLQKKELQEKNQSLEKSALLINNSADIIGIIDDNSLKVEEINTAFTTILGYLPAEVKGHVIGSFIVEEDKNKFDEIRKKQGNHLSFETRAICQNKKIKWLHWNVVVKKGKWYVNARDITEGKRADDEIRRLNSDLHDNISQLEAANKELESFSYSVSHDLRAPLRALSSYSKMMEVDYEPVLDEQAKRLLNNIQANALKMGTLIDDLLAFSRLGRKGMRKSHVDMNRLVRKVISEVGSELLNRTDVNLHDLPPADADSSLMIQVWSNLISNAVKYSGNKEKARIDIGAEQNEVESIYFIKDNGAGFDMKYAENLFGVFQRLHGPNEFEGTGVGLAIVHRIVTRHGGRVWANATPNHGATFYFTIPRHHPKK